MKPPAKLSGKHDNPRNTRLYGTHKPAAKPSVARKGRAKLETSSNDDSDSTGSQDGDTQESDHDSDLEIDEPRIAQWEEEGENDNYLSLDAQVDKEEGSSKGLHKSDLVSMSYGTLLKARRMLDGARVESSPESTDESEDSANSDKEGSIKSSPERQELKRPGKRPHKHAPTEMSSKRPVTRRRQVVEVKKVNYRDPRFSSLADDNARQSFQKNYSFLADLHKTELETLKNNLKRARSMLRSAPRDQRESWEEEVDRLERAFKRAESAVNRDRKDVVEQQALEQARKEEKTQRRGGKGEWHMKKSAKKELLLKARHDALAESGGRLAVRKAIEKRQKKIGQKEKKRRPSFAGREEHADRGGPSKRRKVVA